MKGQSDYMQKRASTADTGALFLANIVDTDRRCSLKITRSTPNEELDSCHDASDNILRNAKFLAPLRTLPLPMHALSNKATGSITVSGRLAASKTRIFQKKGHDWIYISPSHVFHAHELRAGLELGIDARDVRRPGVWKGWAMVRFTVWDTPGIVATDWVMLRVAPILIHNHLQRAEQLFVQSAYTTERNKTNARMQVNLPQAKFVQDLNTIVRAAGLPLFRFNDQVNHDIWVQDFFEPGYMSIPGPYGPIGLRVMIRSAQIDRVGGRQVFQTLRSDSVGAVQHLAGGDTSDSTGNLEAIPPYYHNEKNYPAGRAVMGSQDGIKPFMMDFMRAQEQQDPIELDTSWLFIGHTDEFMQFLPFNSERGWVLIVTDPLAGLNLLRDATAAGYGKARSHSRPYFSWDREKCLATNTVEDTLLLPDLPFIQSFSAEAIEKNIDIIKRETGITEDDIIRVPALFHVDDFKNQKNAFHYHCRKAKPLASEMKKVRTKVATSHFAKKSTWPVAKQKKQKEDEKLEALNSTLAVSTLYPSPVNSIVLSSSIVVAPNPWGPLVRGKDVLAEAMTKAYAKANYTVIFIDDWFSHFAGGGDIHCATNTLREMAGSWF
ncbi:hypothetical protein CDD80_39 [Ophiocordyceps camponoti-rufipedis]|uniref:Protein-arginine deiminase C-terminal domain-containing protein n=1 Tax=Ophiocordyceps camponoti-rufipedis TaxID=2004952 RepID=A0A2C5ZP61_9HYPO|nr:hypothetical protein CDD80_39 [Ophiocordyceps camponoti-rufipedis]